MCTAKMQYNYSIGGISQIKNKQWLEICKALGFAPKKSIAIILKDYYEKYLHPFDLFKKGQNNPGFDVSFFHPVRFGEVYDVILIFQDGKAC
jgi:ARID/BRIGHT DNA binding domain